MITRVPWQRKVGQALGGGPFSTLQTTRTLADMTPRQVKEALERAVDAVAGSFIARADAIRARDAWRMWRA